MNTRFVIFISILSVVLTLACIYVARRIIDTSEFAERHQRIVWFGVGLFILFQLTGPLLYRAFPTETNYTFVLQWITYTSLGVFACLFFYTLTVDAVLKLTSFFLEQPPDLGRRAFFGVSALTVGSSLVGVTQALMGPKVYEVEVPIKDLPEDLVGFKIAQVSDLHVGPTIDKTYTKKVTDMVNALNPDVVALTGDFIDGGIHELKDHVAPLGLLQAKKGIFYVTGNHEYYWGAEQWIEHFRGLGFQPLINQHSIIRGYTLPVVIAGITDPSAHQSIANQKSDLKKSLEGAPTSAVKILLAHQPKGFDEAAEAGVHLQLSGHTHAGQFFPWSILVALVHRYYKGLYKHDTMWIYVNRGTGYWGPPIRFTVPSEVTLLKLTRQTTSV